MSRPEGEDSPAAAPVADARAEHVVVTNCTVEHGHGGVVIGSETAGDVRHVTVTNCTFTDTNCGIRIKSKRGCGGTVEDLRFDTIVMRRAACLFVINGYYQTDIDSDPKPVIDDASEHYLVPLSLSPGCYTTYRRS
nr:glycosyl hydrolase family 28 protein [Haloferax sp. Atlit-4N]